MYAWLFRHLLFPAYESGLRRRRTLKYLQQLEEQQWGSLEGVRELQWRQLLALVRHAEAHVPFYRERMRRAGLTARAINSPEDFRRLPPLTKADVRAHARELIADNISSRALHWSATGGSTGEPIRFAYDHNSYEWRVAVAARADRWAGWDWGERQFYIWGRALRPEPRLMLLKKRLHNRLLNMRVLSAFDFTDAVLKDYARQLNAFRPCVVVGYTNALYEFARFCKARGLNIWQPKGIIPTAERLYDYQRELLHQVFRAGVFDRYGCREVMNIAAECERHEGLHVCADHLYLELECDGRPAMPGELGEVLVTDLHNYAMPFIRYRNGDLAVSAARPCSCGRGLPLLACVEGRVLDMIVAPDGRYVPGEFFPHLLKDYPGIERYQIYQGPDYRVTVRIMPGPDFTRSHLEEIRRLITGQLGPSANVDVVLVDDIPRTEGGKLRVTISEVRAQYDR